MKEHVKYAVRRQNDGQYAVMMKDLNTNRLTIESLHDTLEEANDALDDLHRKPSQRDVMKFMNDLAHSINKNSQ